MVADALIYHPAVTHFNRYVATTQGRDKALRLVQYFSRFLAWYFYRTNAPAETVKIYETTKKNFGSVRKGIRLGKFVEHFRAAAVAADNKSLDPILRYLAVGRQLGYAVYMSAESLVYVDTAGIRKYEGAKKIAKQGQRAWFVGLACNIVAGLYTLSNQHALAAKYAGSSDAEKAVAIKKLEKDRAATRLQLLSDLCDFWLPLNSLGFIDLDDGVVGLLGTVSSIIGLRSAWNKTA